MISTLIHNANVKDICYMVRHFERHRRNSLSNPWSLRKMAVYHKHYIREQRSDWLLISTFKDCKQRLWENKDIDSEVDSQSSLFSLHISTHVSILETVTLNWAEYLDFQRGRLEKVVRDCHELIALKLILLRPKKLGSVCLISKKEIMR